jgi:MtN3 and saliva related transmembrane protein
VLFIEAIGYIAGALTTVAFVPQLVQTWRSRSAGDVSLSMLAVFTVGLLLWLIYGVALASWPLVLSNAVTLVLTGLLLVLKLRDPLPDRPSHRVH